VSFNEVVTDFRGTHRHHLASLVCALKLSHTLKVLLVQLDYHYEAKKAKIKQNDIGYTPQKYLAPSFQTFSNLYQININNNMYYHKSILPQKSMHPKMSFRNFNIKYICF
jgi:hypothetical protein